jgi:hypothetical protein
MRRVFFVAVLAATLVPAVTASAETAVEKRVAQQIGSHLKQSGQLHNYRVGVKFRDGVAYLNGSVANPEQREIATQLAQQVNGVSHVVCKLECLNEGEAQQQGNFESTAGDRSDSLNRASFEGSQNDASVMQAYEQSGQSPAALSQQPQQNLRTAARPMAQRSGRGNMPVPFRPMAGGMPMRQGNPSGIQQASCPCNGGGGMGMGMGMHGGGEPAPAGFVPAGSGRGPSYDNAQMPGYAWPSYASYPNYAALTYPQQYSPTAWPYIGPFYPYPQVPLAWRKVSLEWDDGWWFLDFSAHNSSH